MSKYQEILNRLEISGLTQREFGEQEGLSPSMVSYYVRKAKAEQKTSNGLDNFTSIELITSSERNIEITTTSGVKVSIPIC